MLTLYYTATTNTSIKILLNKTKTVYKETAAQVSEKIKRGQQNITFATIVTYLETHLNSKGRGIPVEKH
jgi:hypothetical protein